MKSHFRCLRMLFLVSAGLYCIPASSQCTAAQLNWDYHDYFFNSATAAPYGSYISDGQEMAQKFAIGTNWLSIATSSSALVNPGAGNSAENTTHTGDIAGYTGADVQYNPGADGQTITFTFNNEVSNLSFTLYDVDLSQRIDFSAKNAANVAQNINVLTYSGSILTINNNNAVSARITASATSLGNASNAGTATITVSTSVKTFTLTITTAGTDPVFWLSDINACVTGNFPTNYQQTGNNRPFVGRTQSQSDYFIVTPDNQNIYQMDPATGKCWWLFGDSTIDYVNSFAYDPYNHWLYYIAEDASAVAGNKTLKKYDFNTGTKSTLVVDIETTLGIPTMDQGIQSAAASFYNGALYLGIEGGRSGSGSSTITRESIVWKIDFDASFNPINASKVFAVNAYKNASDSSTHDWGDFIIKNGVLYDFNTARAGNSPYTYRYSSYIHYDLMTGVSTVFPNPTLRPYTGQAGLDWAGNMYLIRDSVAKYNENGTYGGIVKATVVSGPAWVGSAGDASDPFRPKCDFGDAPATYDPNPISPAVHERWDSIRLGKTWDNEWLKKGTTTVEDADDGLTVVPVFAPAGNYLLDVSVYNHSGANATLIAWLDYNGNGVFEASEATTPQTVSSSTALQNLNLFWGPLSSPLTIGDTTYLRVRITSASAGMNSQDATGFFFNGEVEDYKVLVTSMPLSSMALIFDAKTINNSAVKLNWSVDEDRERRDYEVQRSGDLYKWQHVSSVLAVGTPRRNDYQFIDSNPLKGVSYYRLKASGQNGSFKFSETKKVHVAGDLIQSVILVPNPVMNVAQLSVTASDAATVEIQITSTGGKTVYETACKVVQGINVIDLPVQKFSSGTYVVHVVPPKGNAIGKLLIINK